MDGDVMEGWRTPGCTDAGTTVPHQRPRQPSGHTYTRHVLSTGDTVDPRMINDRSDEEFVSTVSKHRGGIGCDHYSLRVQIALVLYLFDHSEACSRSEG